MNSLGSLSQAALLSNSSPIAMPIEQVFKMTVNANDVAEVTEILKELCIQVHDNEPGTLIYYSYKVEGKNEFVSIERYEDEAAFEQHMAMPHFVKFTKKIAPFMLEDQDLGSGQKFGGFIR